ncbi:MAG: type II secretion system F family protein [Thermorudis peleae]|nr:type II secretion system F family protein [Thermorudis peleae]
MATPLLVPALLLLAAAIALVVAGLLQAREANPLVEQRLEQFGARQEFEGEGSAGRASNVLAQQLDRAVQGRSFAERLRTDLARADLRLTVGEYLLIRAASVSIGFLVGFVLGRGPTRPFMGLLMGILVAMLGWLAPQWYVAWRARRRLRAFVNQLGDTITLMANSLRAGYSLLQTIELVSRESPSPMRDEFQRVVREVGFGIPTQEALQHLLRRIPSEDLDLLITAMNIQHEVGGNLAQILDIIGETIRERVRIQGEIRVLTAQQTLSGYIISGLPIALAVFLFILNPDYMTSLFTFPWIILPILGFVSMVIGFIMMRRIVSIEV